MGDSGDFVFSRNAAGVLEFRGDFEGLYQAQEDPWGQSGEDPRMKEYYKFSRSNLARALAELGPGLWPSYDARAPYSPAWLSLLEVGCGAGHVANFLREEFPEVPLIVGMDVSPTAVERARESYPAMDFRVCNIGAPGIDAFLGRRQWDVVLLNQMLWYVLGRLPAVFENALTLLRPNGCLVVQLAFLDNQEYGREIVDGWHGLLRYVLDHHAADFQLASASYDASDRFAPYHDGLLVLRAENRRRCCGPRTDGGSHGTA